MIDTRIVGGLKVIESVAVIPRVASTNLIARRIVNECIENELSLPQAVIIAGEQFAGRGRNDRRWSSPPGKGIYATTLITRPLRELPLIPLAMANVIAAFLRDAYGIDARIKWPNDVLVDRRKIAGILMEARVQDDRVFLLIGTGINVEPVQDDTRPNAVAISEVAARGFDAIEGAIRSFVEHLDAALSQPFTPENVLRDWRALAVHNAGDAIHCVIGDRTIAGTWSHIDDHGRAVLTTDTGELAVSAGDLFLARP
ncbi:MAG TPA: biotin--[acetyl-CoA-carboxylase] ligase [Thermoanaerobaculia bacterium]|jgi:BirA family biotin operon repressor/biotin-[acetyl-CoA-carboxylase] ligase|nr:biotin--[acetyl-CoA-carboxylase] ligase [Thermoanaerobaculia bacterium]